MPRSVGQHTVEDCKQLKAVINAFFTSPDFYTLAESRFLHISVEQKT